MPERKSRIEKDPELEKFVLDLNSQGKTGWQIKLAIKDKFGKDISDDSVLDYLKKIRERKIGPLDPAVKSARELIAHASSHYDNWITEMQKALDAQNIKQARFAVEEARQWWDRLARVVGLLSPDVNVQMNIHQTFNTNIKTLADVLCDSCKNKIVEMEPDSEGTFTQKT